jgi:ClpP class serine protease
VAIGRGHEYSLVEGVLALAEFGDRHYAAMDDDERFERKFKQFVAIRNGVAFVDIRGPIAWFETWNLATCRRNPTTAEYTRALDVLRADQRVHTVRLFIESPGGTAHGTDEVANAVWRIREGGKRTESRTSIMCFSGAAWIATQCEVVEISPMGLFGCIGAFTILFDNEGFLEKLGWRLEIVRSGAVDSIKGDTSVPRITEGLREDQQRVIDQLGEHFVAAIMRGRGLTRPAVEALHNGKVFMGQRAVEAGLVDRIVEKGVDMPDDTRTDTETGAEATSGASSAKPKAGNGDSAAGPSLAELMAQVTAGKDEVAQLRAELGRQLATNAVQTRLADLGDRVNLGMREAGAEELGIVLARHSELKVGERPAAEVFFSILAAVPDPGLTADSDPAVDVALNAAGDGKGKKKASAAAAKLGEDERAVIGQYVSDDDVLALLADGMAI